MHTRIVWGRVLFIAPTQAPTRQIDRIARTLRGVAAVVSLAFASVILPAPVPEHSSAITLDEALRQFRVARKATSRPPAPSTIRPSHSLTAQRPPMTRRSVPGVRRPRSPLP